MRCGLPPSRWHRVASCLLALAGVSICSHLVALCSGSGPSLRFKWGASASPSASELPKPRTLDCDCQRPEPADRERGAQLPQSPCVIDAMPDYSFFSQPRAWNKNKEIVPCQWRPATALGNDSTAVVLDPCTLMYGSGGTLCTEGLLDRQVIVASKENVRRCWGTTPEFSRTVLSLADGWATLDPRADFTRVPPLPTISSWREFAPVRQSPTRQLRPQLVAGAVSNCEAHRSPRLAFMQQLNEWLRGAGQGERVSFRGGCFSREDPVDIGRKVLQKLPMLANSTFAMAMENSAAPGYASEKVMDAIVVGAVPLVWGGARYSAIMPRAVGDSDGGHPVFIDLAAFGGPSEVGEYMLWLEATGKVDNYRPWTTLPPTASTGNSDRTHWPCASADIVRCGFGHLAALEARALAEIQLWMTERHYGRKFEDSELEPWLLASRQASAQYMTAGDASLTRLIGSNASFMPAPWRHRRADPTLEEWRVATGRVPNGLGPADTSLDLEFCRCDSASSWCSASSLPRQSRPLSRGRYWWLGAFTEDVQAGRAAPMTCHPWASKAVE